MTATDRGPQDLAGATRAAAGPACDRWALPLICVAQLMATLDVTIVNLSLPSVQAALDLSNAGLAWVIDAYTLAYAGLLLVGGRAGDLLGHRRTLMAGIALFTLSRRRWPGWPRSPGVLLAARAGQGLGAALATPTTLSLITTLVPPGPRRTRAMVAYGSMAGLGITLGLVLGGVLTEYASWRWVFLVNLPIGAVLLRAAPRLLPDTPRRSPAPRPRGGGRAAPAPCLALVYGVIRRWHARLGRPRCRPWRWCSAIALASDLRGRRALRRRARPCPWGCWHTASGWARTSSRGCSSPRSTRRSSCSAGRSSRCSATIRSRRASASSRSGVGRAGLRARGAGS